MRRIIIFTLMALLLSCSSSSSEEVRKSAVAGAFYPADKKELKDTINEFLDNARQTEINGRIFALVAPHAGYVYSGHVAAYSFKHLIGCKVNSVVIMCNSHTAHFRGIAIDDSDCWETPLGTVKIDKNLADKLVKKGESIIYDSTVHGRDHTLEMQVPFLQVALEKDFKIVPILFGNTHDDSYKELARLLAASLGNNDIVIVSTDMSHYPGYEDANNIDQRTLEVVKQKDIHVLEEYISAVEALRIPGEQTLMCGIDAMKTAIELCNILGGEIEILKYANSGDVEIGDKTRVVGYGSAVMYIPSGLKNPGNKEAIEMDGEYLNKEEREKLMAIARSSIMGAVTGKKQPRPEITESRLKENCGAFVTIKKHGQLRGCIGYIQAVKPLYETVEDVAASAAVNDFRFSPVSKEELDELELEISVLTPFRRISDVKEIEVGKHGLYMKRGFNSGLLLPQVATEYGWDRDTFLDHTCMKAGLPTNAWKDKSTEIYIFSAEVFGEEAAE